MKLYGSLTSPYVRKVRMLIEEKQLAVEFVMAAASDPRIPARNPLGKVPVLERDDGSALFDSPVIAEYLDSVKAPTLIPVSGEARWQVLRFAALADGMMDATVVRLLESRRPEPQRSADAIKLQEGKIARAMLFAEQHILDRPWLVENRLTLADIALAAALGYVDFRYPHNWRHGHAQLAKWIAPMSARPSFTGTEPPK